MSKYDNPSLHCYLTFVLFTFQVECVFFFLKTITGTTGLMIMIRILVGKGQEGDKRNKRKKSNFPELTTKPGTREKVKC